MFPMARLSCEDLVHFVSVSSNSGSRGMGGFRDASAVVGSVSSLATGFAYVDAYTEPVVAGSPSWAASSAWADAADGAVSVVVSGAGGTTDAADDVLCEYSDSGAVVVDSASSCCISSSEYIII